MDTLEKQIIDLYHEGMRPSRIVININHSCSVEKVREVIETYKKEEYLSRELKGVPYHSVHVLYLEEKTMFDILQVYPELTYGEAKNIIGGYYQMLGVKKPYSIPFPKEMLMEEIKTKSVEDLSIEYDIPERIIKERLNIPLSKEEYFDKKMQVLATDVNTMKPKAFERKYQKGR